MGDEQKFSEKWDFRRKEHSFDDSSSDDPDSKSIHDPIVQNPSLVLDLNQLDNGTPTVTRGEQPVKTRKRRSKKDESKPEKVKQARRRKPKTVCVEENEKKKEETVMAMDDVGMFMKTLLDDLTASRERLMDWMKTELNGSLDQNVASRPPLKKKAVAAVAAQRSVKKRQTKKEEAERKASEKQSKPDKNGQQMNEPEEKSLEIAQNGGDQVQELDCNAEPLDRFLKSGQGGVGRNYFQQQQQQECQEVQTDMENTKNETVNSQKTVVLAIKAQNLSQRQKNKREANTIKNNTTSMVEITGSETQKDDNFVIPFASKLSSSPSLQSFPVCSSLNSLFPSSSPGITSLASTNFQLKPPVLSQMPDLSEFQTGLTGQGFGNSLFHNNGYFSGFPAAFQPNNLNAGSYNFPAQVNPTTASQQRDNNNMLGGLRMAGGAIRFSGNRFPEAEVANGNNGLSDYRTSSSR